MGKIDEVIKLVQDLCSGEVSWAEGSKRLPPFGTGEQVDFAPAGSVRQDE